MLSHSTLKDYTSVLSKYIDGTIFIEEKMFDNTTNKGWIRDRFAIFREMLVEKKYINNSGLIRPVYDELYVPSDQIDCRVIYHYLKSFNSIKLKIYDEGTTTYSGYIFTQQKRIVSKMVYKLFLDSRFYEDLQEVYCYHPGLMVNVPPSCKMFKISIPNVENFIDSQKREFINTYIGKKCIFFDQGKNLTEPMKQCMERLEDVFAQDELIIKMHPRIDSDYDYKGVTISRDRLPSEFLVTELECKDVLFISYASTSCFTPYLLLNEKPFVIMLLKMGPIKENEQKLIELADRVNESMGYKYIYMPETPKQFNEYLDDILNAIKPAIGRLKNEN